MMKSPRRLHGIDKSAEDVIFCELQTRFPSFGEFVLDELYGGTSHDAESEMAQKIMEAAELQAFAGRSPDKTAEEISLLHSLMCKNYSEKKGHALLESKSQFRKVFITFVQSCEAVYFSAHWDDVDAICIANPKYYRETGEFGEEEQSSYDELMHLDDHNFDAIMKHNKITVLEFYLPACGFCLKLGPILMKAARVLRKHGISTAQVNVIEAKGLMDRFHVSSWPCLILFKGAEPFAAFPQGQPKSVESIVKFVECTLSGREKGNGSLSASARAQKNWHKAYQLVTVQRVMKELGVQRQFSIALQKFKALGCHNEASCQRLAFPTDRKDPPVIIFIGGGMASGKSTVIQSIRHTDFWKRYGDNIVYVSADTMKVNDPIYKALHERGINASGIVHGYSTKAAEELLLAAIQMGRDIIFDGTMMWAPFVQQTIDMVRDYRHRYTIGPGYNNGNSKEEYWTRIGEKAESEPPFLPYRIEMLGVTADAEVAVRRGIVRKLVTGRSVPIEAQLQSHRLYSQNFHDYCKIIDRVMLFDNNRPRVGGEDSPFMIASKEEGEELCVVPAPFASFLHKAKLNQKATCYCQLYPDAKPLEVDRSALNSLRAAFNIQTSSTVDETSHSAL